MRIFYYITVTHYYNILNLLEFFSLYAIMKKIAKDGADK